MRRIIAAIILLCLFAAPAVAQVCSAVPALPDTERHSTYSISSSTGPLSVGFAVYGDTTDFTNWIAVYVNGVATTAYTLTSASGSIGGLCRPITDAVITFTVAQTGMIDIIGARRPRRTSQFLENRGVAARDVNQVISDLTAQLREAWDWRARTFSGLPPTFSITYGSGAPSASAATGSLYIRSDGSGPTTRLYINIGGTSWTSITTGS